MRVDRFHWTGRRTALCLALFATAMLTVAACHGGPVVDLSTKPAQADGTISGTVRGSDATGMPATGKTDAVIGLPCREHDRLTNAVMKTAEFSKSRMT